MIDNDLVAVVIGFVVGLLVSLPAAWLLVVLQEKRHGD